MGMTTTIFPKQNCPSPQKDCNDYLLENDWKNKIEFSDEKLEQITVYQATLSVPVRRNVRNKDILKGKGLFHEMNCVKKDVLKGKGLFHEMNCVKCHAIGFKVEKSEMIPQIEGTVFNPGKEWRTQPLWGIAMIPVVNKHTFLLHDGRARNVEEAILWHGGEAEKVKQKFMNLTKTEREQVLKFVNSL